MRLLTQRCRPGERIPCDGEVMSGASDVNQAMITGEPIPVVKSAGGTVIGNGYLWYPPRGEISVVKLNDSTNRQLKFH